MFQQAQSRCELRACSPQQQVAIAPLCAQTVQYHKHVVKSTEHYSLLGLQRLESVKQKCKKAKDGNSFTVFDNIKNEPTARLKTVPSACSYNA